MELDCALPRAKNLGVQNCSRPRKGQIYGARKEVISDMSQDLILVSRALTASPKIIFSTI